MRFPDFGKAQAGSAQQMTLSVNVSALFDILNEWRTPPCYAGKG